VPEDRARPLARRWRAEATALSGWIKPQLTKLVDRPPDGLEWLHEIKFDAIACMRAPTVARSGC
jgi:ATP-dependent DNA ligase